MGRCRRMRCLLRFPCCSRPSHRYRSRFRRCKRLIAPAVKIRIHTPAVSTVIPPVNAAARPASSNAISPKSAAPCSTALTSTSKSRLSPIKSFAVKPQARVRLRVVPASNPPAKSSATAATTTPKSHPPHSAPSAPSTTPANEPRNGHAPHESFGACPRPVATSG